MRLLGQLRKAAEQKRLIPEGAAELMAQVNLRRYNACGMNRGVDG
jgi:hypothetical protein